MSPLVAYHATRRACRESISQRGLIASEPTLQQPVGVYVFRHDHRHGAVMRGGPVATWDYAPRQDLWQVAYIGPLMLDRFVSNGFILLKSVPPSEVTLVTGH